MLCVFSISCQRLQSCSLEISGVSESASCMPDQSISGDRGVQMGTNRYFMLRRMVFFCTFRVHIGKTRMNPSFLGFYWINENTLNSSQLPNELPIENSDFKPFLYIFDRKVRDLQVNVGEGIEVHFGIFLSRESVPRGGQKMVESEMECRDGK